MSEQSERLRMPEFASMCKHGESVLMCEICEYGYSTPGYSDTSDVETDISDESESWADKVESKSLPPLKFKDGKLYSKKRCF